MSIYNKELTTRFHDAVFDRANFRTEWRLQPNQVYLSSMRLAGLGTSSTLTDSYNGLTGSLGCIESIQLYDGNELLDQILMATQWNGFKTFNKKNEYNVSLGRHLTKTSLGYTTAGLQSSTAASGRLDTDKIKIQTQNAAANTAGETGWVSLKSMLPFLQASTIVPTNVFSKLRLVINWNSAQLKNMFLKNNGVYATLENVVLVADEVNVGKTKELMMKEYEGVSYRPIEHDRVIVPPIVVASAAIGTVAQSNKFNINGFNNKTLHSLVLVQTPMDATTFSTGDDNTEYANAGSMSQWLPTYQFRINGSNKLSRDGWSGKNSRLAALTDIMGSCNAIPGNNMVHLDIGADCIDKAASRVGTLDYTAIKIDERVAELQIEFGRTGVYDNANTTQQLELNMFGEVSKAIILSGSTYSVVYV